MKNITKEIVDFLNAHGYNKTIKPEKFSINSKIFLKELFILMKPMKKKKKKKYLKWNY